MSGNEMENIGTQYITEGEFLDLAIFLDDKQKDPITATSCK